MPWKNLRLLTPDIPPLLYVTGEGEEIVADKTYSSVNEIQKHFIYERQTARTVSCSSRSDLDTVEMFKNYNLHNARLFHFHVTRIKEIYVSSLNYWLSSFVMEVAKKSGE